MSTNEITIEIDQENDVIYVFKKNVDASTTSNIDVDSDITVRIDPRSHDVVGFTITDFSKSRFSKISHEGEYFLQEEFDFIINNLNAIHRGVEHSHT